MHSRLIKCFIRATALTACGLAVAAAQTQDNSQNGLLNGKFAFRHVAVQNVDEFYNPTEITAAFGTITFDGHGNYSITGTSVDNTVSSGAPQPLSQTGTYAIGSNGLGYLSNELYPGDPNAYIYGATAQGVYVGSSTESQGDQNTFNDIFIAIPLGTAPTNASFTTAYQSGLIDFTGAGSTAIKNALFELTPNGKGAFGTINLNGQAANLSAATVTQSISGATYNFNSDGSATLTIPLSSGTSATNALFTGTKTIFQSANGSFILGWTAGGYDVFFGVSALTVTGANSLSQGLYFTAALEDGPFSNGTDSYYGGTSNSGDANGDGDVHQRVNLPGAPSYDYLTDDQIDLNANGTTPTDFNGYNYLFGDGALVQGTETAQAFVGTGTGGFFSLVVGLHAPPFSGPGVYLNPIGVTNAASFQPVTASLAPGELITLYGTNLYSGTGLLAQQGGQTFPTSLGGVSVTIDGTLCPIYYVSPTQLAVIVPYEVASNPTGLANIQVSNNSTLSNVVQVYLSDSAPGSFAQNEEGFGNAAAVHAATGQLLNDSNPAQPGEYISLFLTGLGTVTPSIQDGALGPSNPLSWSDLYNAGNLAVYFNDTSNGSSNAGNIQFAGLAPTLAGLYQINVQVPTTGLDAGDVVYVEFVTDAAASYQIQIPYGSGASRSAASARSLARASRIQAMRSRPAKTAARRVRRGGPATATGSGSSGS